MWINIFVGLRVIKNNKKKNNLVNLWMMMKICLVFIYYNCIVVLFVFICDLFIWKRCVNWYFLSLVSYFCSLVESIDMYKLDGMECSGWWG